MVIGSLISTGLSLLELQTVDQLLLAAAMCTISAWLGWKLHKLCDDGKIFEGHSLPEDV
jgi:hypothetical protein